jgi:putative IMPACT (imprinted ancient) family translation regulator
MEPYRTVAERTSTAFEVQGSEFIGHVTPAEDVASAEAFVAEIEAEYDDATHNVPAYRVPADGETAPEREAQSQDDGTGRTPASDTMLREYSSDDGEPSGSAGKPALNVLQQREIRNVACVVTRYYGGTNLGVGGLARAYSRAVKEGVDAAGVIEQTPRERFAVTVAYDDSGSVRSILESTGAEFEADYGEDVQFAVRAPTEEAAEVRDQIRSGTSGRAEIE